MMEAWMYYKEAKRLCVMKHMQEMKRRQGVMARALILEGIDDTLTISRATGLDVEGVEREVERINEAWCMALKDEPDVEILKTGVRPEEIMELKMMKRDRRNLLFTAFANGLPFEILEKYFNLSPEETDIWHCNFIRSQGGIVDDD